jgi:hypothetical protein
LQSFSALAGLREATHEIRPRRCASKSICGVGACARARCVRKPKDQRTLAAHFWRS